MCVHCDASSWDFMRSHRGAAGYGERSREENCENDGQDGTLVFGMEVSVASIGAFTSLHCAFHRVHHSFHVAQFRLGTQRKAQTQFMPATQMRPSRLVTEAIFNLVDFMSCFFSFKIDTKVTDQRQLQCNHQRSHIPANQPKPTPFLDPKCWRLNAK